MDELAREACREPEEDEIPEATPVVTRKVSLAEAVRYGIDPAKAGIMRLGFRTQKEQYVEKIDSALAGIKISL